MAVQSNHIFPLKYSFFVSKKFLEQYWLIPKNKIRLQVQKPKNGHSKKQEVLPAPSTTR